MLKTFHVLFVKKHIIRYIIIYNFLKVIKKEKLTDDRLFILEII